MKTVLLSFILFIFSLTTACASEPGREYKLPVVNFEKISDGFFVNKSNEFYLRYMWESFVALNWPNKIESRDTPDIKQTPSSRAPLVWETKAAWRVLDPERDDSSRYYTRPAYVLSPNKKECFKAPAGAGLVALHIHRLTRLSHVASTFEQVDNVAILAPDTPASVHPSFNPGTSNLTQQDIWPPYGNRGFSGPLPPVITAKNELPPIALRQPNNISRAVDIPTAVKAMNREFQRKYKDWFCATTR